MTKHIEFFLDKDNNKVYEKISSNFSSENDDKSEDSSQFNIDTAVEGIEIDFNALSMLNFIRIDSVFLDNGYISFRNYASYRNKKLLSDITKEFILEYSQRQGVGGKKVRAVMETLAKVIKNSESIKFKSIAAKTVNPDIAEFDKEIELVFVDRKLKKFLEYCNDRDIQMISEITDSVYDDISKIRGFGVTKINLIRSTLDEYLQMVKKRKVLEENYRFKVVDKWYTVLKEVELCEIAKIMNLELVSKLDMKLSEVQNKLATDFDKNRGDITLLINKINSFRTIDEIFFDLGIKGDKKYCLSDKEFLYLKYKVESGFTLEKIGIMFNLTRERIRQIINRGVKKIDFLLKQNSIDIVLRLTFPKRSFCYIDEFFKLVSEKRHIFVKAMLNFSDISSVRKYASLGIIYFDNTMDLSAINTFIDSLPETIKLADYIPDIKRVLARFKINDIGVENIEMLLVEGGFKNYSEYYSRVTITFLNAFEIIFKDYIKEPLCMDEEGYLTIRAACKKHLGFDFDSSVRAVDARVRDSELIILVDKKTYQHIDNLEFNEKVISYIDEKLEYELGFNPVTSAKIINDKYSDKLKTYGVYNKYILYSLISIYLEKYKIGKGNTLDISLDLEDLKKTREEQILEVIEENNGLVSINDFIGLTSWSLSKIDDILSKSHKVIKVGHSITSSKYLNMSEAVKEKFREKLRKYIKRDGFIVTTLLFEDIISDIDILKFLEYYQIEKSDKISSIVKFLMPELKGNTLFLYTNDSKFKKFEDIILDKFNTRCTISDILEFIESYEISPAARSKFVNNIISGGHYIRLSQKEIINKDIFEISSENLSLLKGFIEKQFGDYEYISLKEITGYNDELPDIGYEWNPYFIEGILSLYGYKNIERTFFDVGTERLVIVRDESHIHKYDELIYYILKTEYSGELTEKSIHAFLVSRGVLYNNRKNVEKRLPFDLYKSDKFKIDELGNVELV